MTALADRPLADVLAQVAAERPAPGGGSSAAWACALAAGLVEMAAAFAGTEAAGSRASVLRAEALALAERDLESYAPVLEAQRAPAEAPGRAERIALALGEAAEVPLAVCAAAAEVAGLAARLSREGAPALRGDAVTGALLAEAACRAAARLVELNLAGAPGDPRVDRAREHAAAAWDARAEALA